MALTYLDRVLETSCREKFFPSLWRPCKGIVHFQAKMQSPPKHTAANPVFPCPFGKNFCLSVVLDKSIVWPVSMAGWRSQRRLGRPSVIKPRLKRAFSNSYMARPSGDGHRAALECHKSIFPGVSSLFAFMRPSAVIRRIWPIVVHSFDLVIACRGFSHVRQKVNEGIAPAVANENSTPAPPWVVRVCGRVASLLHVLPSSVFLCVSSTMRLSRHCVLLLC